MDAINDGYDEITHIYFVVMQAMPDSVGEQIEWHGSHGGARAICERRGPECGPDEVADCDDGAERKIESDPTLVVVESLYVPENGDLSPAYAPYVGDAAANRGTRLSRRWSGGTAGLTAGRLSRQFRQALRAGGGDAQSWCADCCGHGWLGAGAGART